MTSFAPIPGHPSYLASSDGYIVGPRRILKPGLLRGGYQLVHLSSGGDGVTAHTVHSLILSTFCGERPDGFVAAHLDGNPANNRLDNLQWVTRQENEEHKTSHGTAIRGEKHSQAKLTEGDIPEIRRLWGAGLTAKEIGHRYGVSAVTAHRAATGRKWQHVPTHTRRTK